MFYPRDQPIKNTPQFSTRACKPMFCKVLEYGSKAKKTEISSNGTSGKKDSGHKDLFEVYSRDKGSYNSGLGSVIWVSTPSLASYFKPFCHRVPTRWLLRPEKLFMSSIDIQFSK